MSPTELKSAIIKKISLTDDVLILEQIRKILKVGEYYIEEARKFTPEQKMRIENSLEQYRNGYFLTNEEAEKDILEWIE